MNTLDTIGLAFILAVGSSQAAAGGNHDRGHHRHGLQVTHHGAHQHARHHRRHHYFKHGRGHHAYRHHKRSHRLNHRYRHYDHHRRHYGYNDYYPAFFGAALVGSVIGHQLFHTHAGRACYTDHGDNAGYSSGSQYNEVAGCHRIERLPNGRERRVEVPLSECR